MGLFGKKAKKTIDIYAPMSGQAIAITEVDDPVFSQKMVGEGIAIVPIPGNIDVVAPCAGEIIQIFPTGHAFGIKTEEGVELLVHLGIDTVELKGEGYEIVGTVGSKVEMGDVIVKMNVDTIVEHKLPTVSPVVIVNMHQVESIDIKPLALVNAGKNVIMSVEL